MEKPSIPAVGQKIAMNNMVGEIKQVNQKSGLAMVLWPDNPIEDWIQISNLGWNGKHWTATIEA